MPTVTITLTDTPAGAVAIHTDFRPAVGAPCSPAQAAALDIVHRTKRGWGMANLPAAHKDYPNPQPAAKQVRA